MPLVKHVPQKDPAIEMNITNNAGSFVTPVQVAAVSGDKIAMAPYTGRKKVDEGAPMTKDDYWRRREERDIETGVRIRRSGVWQAAIQSVTLGQYNTGTTAESFLELVAKAATAGLEFVEETK